MSRSLESVLPQPFGILLEPLFDELPLDSAMGELVPKSVASKQAHRLASMAAAGLEYPELRAGIWLYVDDLESSHAASQSLSTPTGSYWHAIMHRREGDFGNSKYWLRMAGSHPVWRLIPGYDPMRFVDDVASRFRENPGDLVDLQRKEWWALFSWCVEQAHGGEA